MGKGLVAVKKLVDEFQLDTRPGIGHHRDVRVQGGTLRTGGFSRPYKGLSICGDSFVIEEREGATLAAVIDGLGHGYESSVAAERAVEVIREFGDLSVGPLLLRSTRSCARRAAPPSAC